MASSLLLVLSLFAGSDAFAQAVTRAYKASTPLQRGMIVRLNDKDASTVEAVKGEAINKMEGVVVAANDAPVTLSSEDQSFQQVFVATTGRYNVLVSNQNGVIKKDDYITISSLAGVGMKADGKQPRIIGKAIAGFDGKTNVSGRTTVKNSDKTDIPIALGLVAVDVNVGHNPIEEKADSIVPGLEVLQRAAGAIADKPVTPAQIYLSLAALIVAAIIAGSILYAGVRTSMIAIGRNPLAKGSVMRNLLQVVVTSIIILIIGVTAVYLILKL
ncbi:MAG: rane protein of unknown function [Candidatus Saccharibacteria bacterium]|nr:rane protein of unknown function [Candidatus Saccharibacteria bacterium]